MVCSSCEFIDPVAEGAGDWVDFVVEEAADGGADISVANAVRDNSSVVYMGG